MDISGNSTASILHNIQYPKFNFQYSFSRLQYSSKPQFNLYLWVLKKLRFPFFLSHFHFLNFLTLQGSLKHLVCDVHIIFFEAL